MIYRAFHASAPPKPRSAFLRLGISDSTDPVQSCRHPVTWLIRRTDYCLTEGIFLSKSEPSAGSAEETSEGKESRLFQYVKGEAFLHKTEPFLSSLCLCLCVCGCQDLSFECPFSRTSAIHETHPSFQLERCAGRTVQAACRRCASTLVHLRHVTHEQLLSGTHREHYTSP